MARALWPLERLGKAVGAWDRTLPVLRIASTERIEPPSSPSLTGSACATSQCDRHHDAGTRRAIRIGVGGHRYEAIAHRRASVWLPSGILRRLRQSGRRTVKRTAHVTDTSGLRAPNIQQYPTVIGENLPAVGIGIEEIKAIGPMLYPRLAVFWSASIFSAARTISRDTRQQSSFGFDIEPVVIQDGIGAFRSASPASHVDVITAQRHQSDTLLTLTPAPDNSS